MFHTPYIPADAAEKQKRSRFLHILRTLDADTLPPLKTKKMSNRAVKRLMSKVERRLEDPRYSPGASLTMSRIPNPDLAEHRVSYDEAVHVEVLTHKKTFLKAALCVGMLVCMLFPCFIFHAEIGTFLSAVFRIGDGTPDTVVTTPADETDEKNDSMTDLVSISVTDITFSENATVLTVQLNSPAVTDRAAAIQYRRYALSFWDESADCWRTGIDVTNDNDVCAQAEAGDIHFLPDGAGTATAEIRVGQRLDNYGSWLWKLDIYGFVLVHETDEDGNKNRNGWIAEVLTDGYASAQFGTEIRDTVRDRDEQNDIPPDKIKTENETDTMTLQTSPVNHAISEGKTVLSVVLTNNTAQIPGCALFYRKAELERWDAESGDWEIKEENTIQYEPTKMLMAGEIHFWFDAGNPAASAEMKLAFRLLEKGIYRIVLEDFVSVRDALEGEENDFGLVAEDVDHGAVSCIFVIE